MDEKDYFFFTLFGKKYRVSKPTRLEITDDDRVQFEQAEKVLDQYHGLPQQLMAAFEKFIRIENVPLFHAGITSFLIAHSFSHGYEYNAKGLEAAQRWLLVAQEMAPEEKYVLLVGFDYYLAKKEYEPCRELLERGLKLYPNSFEFHNRHISFLTRRGTVRQIEKVIQNARKLRLTSAQKETLINQEAYAYLARRQWSKAVKSYGQVTRMLPNNPWAWHNLSIAQYESKNGFTAFYSNRRALSLMDFGAARDMQKRILPLFLIQTGAVIAGIIIVFSPILF